MKNLLRILVASVLCAMVAITAAGCKTESAESTPPGQDKVTYKCPQCGDIKTLPRTAAAEAHKCPHCKINMKPQ